jgi:hypothetical protein
MSRTNPSRGLRAIALLAVFATARAAAPAATQAQSITPEQALLHRTPVALSDAAKPDPVPLTPVDGERALLGRWPGGVAPEPKAAGDLGDVAPVDAERALLGRIARPETRRLVLAQ